MDKKKFIESLIVDGFSIKTDTGYKKIKASHKTIPYDVYEIQTLSHILKCADNHIVFDANFNEIFVKDLNLNSVIMTDVGPEKIIKISTLDSTESMYDLEIDSDNHRYYTNGILSHNTTLAAVYLLYEACFPKSPGDILIVAHKGSHAAEVLRRMKQMYYSMPMWMKPGMAINNMGRIELDNGMRIFAEATTGNAARGKSIKIAYCVDGKTDIQIRHKETKEIRTINIEDLYNCDFYK